MKINCCLPLLLAGFFIGGCEHPPEPVVSSMTEDWGVVQHMEFVRSGRHSAYFHVITNKVQFDEIDITDFPDGKIKVGDTIFLQTVLTKKSAKVSYCKGGLCQPHSTCYGWQPCFSSYQSKLDLL